ncbi:MAG: enoyl-CoA hydratase/isomerase family protein [Bacteriovoracales bacterium]
MASFFTYDSLSVEIENASKSIILEIKNPLINSKTILELEHFFSWLCNHIEVNSVLITGAEGIFSYGFNLEEFSKLNNSEIQKLWQKLQKVVYMCFFLPQTIVFDLKESAKGSGAEFAIGGDIRIAKEGAEIKFDHLRSGLIPNCGGIGFLECIISQAYVRNWILMGDKIPKEQLISSGFIHSFYDESNLDYGKNLLNQISKIPPIARIQAKRSLLEPLISKLDKSLIFENEFSVATLKIDDWRKIISNEEYILFSPKNLSALLGKDLKSMN